MESDWESENGIGVWDWESTTEWIVSERASKEKGPE